MKISELTQNQLIKISDVDPEWMADIIRVVPMVCVVTI